MSTLNGFGTTFYGQCDYELNGSYVTTNWFVLAYLPIIPLFSARVYYVHTANLSLTTEYRYQKVPLHFKQILQTWAFSIVFIVSLFLIIGLIAILQKSFSQITYLVLSTWILAGYFSIFWKLPDYFHYRAKLKAGFDPNEVQFISPSAKKTSILIGLLLLVFSVFMMWIST